MVLVKQANPIVKWAGGKRQLISELLSKVPEEFNTYHEFFLGGGALFFELYNLGRLDDAVLSDVNPNLMNVYQVTKQKPYELIEELKSNKYSNEEAIFYARRSEAPVDKVQQAARFVYLNKTAFNGLYRENSSGKFNVPFGRYKNPRIVDAEGILAASEALSTAKLLCGDFGKIIDYARAGDFAYFDPPYCPASKTASFTAYSKQQFGFREQLRLKNVFETLEERGVMLLLSNSYTQEASELYAGKQTEVVYANRMINCKAEKRGLVKELLVVGRNAVNGIATKNTGAVQKLLVSA